MSGRWEAALVEGYAQDTEGVDDMFPDAVSELGGEELEECEGFGWGSAGGHVEEFEEAFVHGVVLLARAGLRIV